MRKIEFSNEIIQEMINNYQNNNISTRQLGEMYNVSKTVISRILKENNIVLDHNNRKYQLDINTFETIDTNEKAYWLGFIAADGCNYERSSNASIILNIHQRDKEHLEKFRKFVNGKDLEIKEYIQNTGFSNNTPMCKIVINSKKMSQDLSNKGIVPKKSLILEPPKIDKKFFLPFILGYFDGDGSIYKTNQNLYHISFEGTKELLEWINSILNISTRLEKRNENDKNNYYIRCGGTNKVYNIMSKLYNSTSVHLNRKYEIYQNLSTVVLNRNIE